MRPVSEGRWLMLRITQPRCGSNATLPQFVPPITPGYWMVPPRLEGVKMPSLRWRSISFRHCLRSQGLSPQASSLLSVVGANGCGFVGKGCVGQLWSPGTSDWGTGRSSIGKIGSPVSRLRRKRKPILVACATAGMSLPSLRTVIRLGWQIIIQDVVVHDLIIPDQLAAGSAECNDGVSVGIASQPLAAVVVRAGAAGGYEDKVSSGIHRQLSPDVGSTGASGALVCPGLECRVRRLAGDGVPKPAQRSGASVEGPHYAALLRRGSIIADGGAHDDQVANHNRWRCNTILSGVCLIFAEIDAA